MKAADVMVSNVITVGLDASIGEVAATLLTITSVGRRLSARTASLSASSAKAI
jgi:diphthamide synthase (EF-2-diphthine--ammonia ligase)